MMLVLYIEDEPNDYTLVERYLRSTQHELLIATNVDDAWQALAQQPDLVLVDMLINQSRQGFDFVQHARDRGYAQPVVAITGLSLPTDLERCYAVGCTEVLQKPYTIHQLAATLNRYLS
jgi:CheY-like chemotaxis protein